MSTRARARRSASVELTAEAVGFNHVRKDFDDVAERIFRDDSPADSFFGDVDEVEDPAA